MNNFHNPELRKVCLELVMRNFDNLIHLIRNKRVRITMRDGYFPCESLQDFIKGRDEFGSIVCLMRDDVVLSRMYSEGRMEQFIFAVLDGTLRRVFMSGAFKSTRWNKLFDETYKVFEKELYAQEQGVRAIASLRNFKSDMKEIELDGIRIKKLSDDEIANFFNVDDISEVARNRGDSDLRYAHCLVKNWSYKKSRESPLGGKLEVSPREKFDMVVRKLRLFKGGDISIDGYWRGSSSLLEGSFMESAGYLKRKSSKFVYQLNRIEIHELIEFIKKLEGVYPFKERKQNSYLNTAIKYYNYAKEREFDEDKVVDYIIALEALYLTTKEGEYRYRLSNRCALLLGASQQERKEIFELVRDMYDLRSGIVHGSYVSKSNEVTSKEQIEKLEGYVRESINRFLVLEKKYKKNTIHEKIDYCAFAFEKKSWSELQKESSELIRER